MTPQDRQEFEDMKRLVEHIRNATDIVFVEQVARRLQRNIDDSVSETIAVTTLNTLRDVDTSGVTNGQVIKYNSTSGVWENANDIDT